METSNYAGLNSERLDYLTNYENKKCSKYNISTFTQGNSNNIYDIIHHTCDKKSEELNNSVREAFYKQSNGNPYAGLSSTIMNDFDIGRKRKILTNYSDNNMLKEVIQQNINKNDEEANNASYFLSNKGYTLTPKRCLSRYIDDNEINNCFSTKYAVTDKASGKTEIMVERKSGCSNVIVQNFSEFDAYSTYKNKDVNSMRNQKDSFVHTIMGIVPREGINTEDKKQKTRTIYSEKNCADRIAPDNYWLCPTVESERVKKKRSFL